MLYNINNVTLSATEYICLLHQKKTIKVHLKMNTYNLSRVKLKPIHTSKIMNHQIKKDIEGEIKWKSSIRVLILILILIF